MKRKTILVSIFLLSLSIGMLSLPPIEAGRPGLVTYDGYVKAMFTGFVIEGAKVTLLIQNMPAIVDYTDENGYFKIMYWRPYDPDLLVEAWGFVDFLTYGIPTHDYTWEDTGPPLWSRCIYMHPLF